MPAALLKFPHPKSAVASTVRLIHVIADSNCGLLVLKMITVSFMSAVSILAPIQILLDKSAPNSVPVAEHDSCACDQSRQSIGAVTRIAPGRP